MTSKELNEFFNKTRRTPNISLTPEQVKELIKDLEQKEYTDRKNTDLLETINCIKNHAMIKKTKGLGIEVIASFHSNDDDFEKVCWAFDIIKY